MKDSKTRGELAEGKLRMEVFSFVLVGKKILGLMSVGPTFGSNGLHNRPTRFKIQVDES